MLHLQVNIQMCLGFSAASVSDWCKVLGDEKGILDSLGLLSEGSLENLWFGIRQGEIGGAKFSASRGGEGNPESLLC